MSTTRRIVPTLGLAASLAATTAVWAEVRTHDVIWESTERNGWFFAMEPSEALLDWADVAGGHTIDRITIGYATNSLNPITANVRIFVNENGFDDHPREQLAFLRLTGLPGRPADAPGDHYAWLVTVDLEDIEKSFVLDGPDLDGDGLVDFGYLFHTSLQPGAWAGPLLALPPSPEAGPGIMDAWDIFEVNPNDPNDFAYAWTFDFRHVFLQTYLRLHAAGAAPDCASDLCAAADVVPDCRVDLADLSVLLSNYGVTSGATFADGDIYPPGGDGAVNLGDLSLMISLFGQDCSPDGCEWERVPFESPVPASAVVDIASGPAAARYAVREQYGVAYRLLNDSWSLIGSFTKPSPFVGAVYCATAFDFGSGEELVVGGFFDHVDQVEIHNIARWDGSAWHPVGAGVSGSVRAMGVYDDGSGPALVIVGGFSESDGTTLNGVARWDGQQWTPLGTGVFGYARAMTVFDDALYVGGVFSEAGGVPANGVAKWDGQAWTGFGSGLTDPVYVNSVAIFDDGGGPKLFAGGRFTMAGGGSAARIAMWDGAAWHPVGGGFDETVDHLVVADDGRGPALFASGLFRSAGAVSTRHVARWDGQEWTAPGGGVDRRPSALFLLDTGDGPALHMAGPGFAWLKGDVRPVTSLGRWRCP